MTDPGFEFDPKKNASNLAKNGIGFDTASDVFDDPNRVRGRALLGFGDGLVLSGVLCSLGLRLPQPEANNRYHIGAKGDGEGAKTVWGTVRRTMVLLEW